MQKSFELFEWAILSKKKFPSFVEKNDDDMAKILSMINCGFCCPLTQRDETGARIVLLQFSNWDPDKFTSKEAARLLYFVVFILLEEEETQKYGLKVIVDYNGFVLKHVISVVDGMELINFYKKYSPVKIKGIYFCEIPTIAKVFVDISRSVLKEKLVKRMHILKSFDDLKNYVNTDLLPKKYSNFNGTQTEAEMIEELSRLVEKNLQTYYEFVRFEVDWEKAQKSKLWLGEECEDVGSFRSLKID